MEAGLPGWRSVPGVTHVDEFWRKEGDNSYGMERQWHVGGLDFLFYIMVHYISTAGLRSTLALQYKMSLGNGSLL